MQSVDICTIVPNMQNSVVQQPLYSVDRESQLHINTSTSYTGPRTHDSKARHKEQIRANREWSQSHIRVIM